MKRPYTSEAIQQAINKTLAAFGCQAAIVIPIWAEDIGTDTTPTTIYRGNINDDAVDEVLSIINENARESMRERKRRENKGKQVLNAA